MSISDTTTLELGGGIQSGDITAVQTMEASLARIKTMEPSIHAFVTVSEKKAMKQAEKIQADTKAGRLKGPLIGVPAAIKDNMCTKGMRTTCSSRIPGNFVPTYTVQAVPNLGQVGAVILGKINMDEFAMGSATEAPAFGATRNPWSLGHMPGGSFGGSCATVAAGECFYALGSDTGGSTRQPSSLRGVTGIKSTYGTVSRYGLITHGSSLDQIGPVARDVPNYVAVLEVLASHGPKDSISMKRRDCDFTSALSEDTREMRVGIPESYSGQGPDQKVKSAALEAAGVPGEKGAVVEIFDLKLAEYAIPACYIVTSAETSSNLSRLDDVKYGYRAPEYERLHSMYKKSRSPGFGPEVKQHIMLGSFVLSSGYYDAYYLKALRTRALIKKEFDRALTSYNVILAPAVPSATLRLGQSLGDPLKMHLGDIYIIPVNLADLPRISLPCGLDSGGLPIGLQLIGDYFKKRNIIQVAYAYEKTREWKLSLLAAGKAKEPSGALTGRAERRSHK